VEPNFRDVDIGFRRGELASAGIVIATMSSTVARPASRGRTMQQNGIAPDHVSLAARIAENIGELAAIATHAWCDDAAQAVAPIRPQATVCVTIGIVDEQGRLRRVDEVVIDAWSGGPAALNSCPDNTLGSFTSGSYLAIARWG
jgi:hypothetical protein